MNCRVSIIIPVFNEAENVVPIKDRLFEKLDDFKPFEIIYIDDGSADGTLERIQELSRCTDNIFYISFSRNFGHQNALRAGLEVCRGDAVITMDGDMQHPPEVIPELITKWRDGYDIVTTVRRDSPNIGIFKRYSSGLFYRLLNFLSATKISKGSADFRLMDKKVVQVIRSFTENEIFLRGIVQWIGFKQFEVPFEAKQRLHGKTKYSLLKMMRLALLGITAFSVLPLRMSVVAGFIVAALSFCYGSYAFYVRLFSENAVSGWASLMTGVYFLGGIQLIAIGVCGEYIGKIHTEVKNRPAYIIRDSFLPNGTSKKS